MPSFSLDISGIEQLRRALSPENIRTAVNRGVKQSGPEVAALLLRTFRRNVPVKTGRLKRSLAVNVRFTSGGLDLGALAVFYFNPLDAKRPFVDRTLEQFFTSSALSRILTRNISRELNNLL